ncbi:LysR substrate-binding domain-containing protein [Shimia sp. SDUM112013]|uniref:LysR substrate-binding domain-containing protein n=1 Tax=Shimia sp. SDUM112013 TaxID=3136160 RepID=UPI0032EFFDE0
MRKLPPLNALRAFESAGRHLNFRLAAEELGVTQGAVAQQVRGLEAQLGVKLFDRLPRGLTLTDEGRRYHTPVGQSFDMIADATSELRPQEQVVTISTTPSVATKWLVARLGAFSRDYPNLRVRLDASFGLANFQSDGVDIAIRQGQPPFGPGLVAEILFPPDLIAVCHPDLPNGDTPLRTPQDLRHHTVLLDGHGQWTVFLNTLFSKDTASTIRRISFNQTALAIDAAIAGQGVALADRALVATDLAQGRLCEPFPVTGVTGTGYYLVHPRRPRHSGRVDLVKDWLLAQVYSGLTDPAE